MFLFECLCHAFYAFYCQFADLSTLSEQHAVIENAERQFRQKNGSDAKQSRMSEAVRGLMHAALLRLR